MDSSVEKPNKNPNFKKVSIAEFFEKNKHILGFDNPSKALLTTLKEFCDNSLDACEEKGIIPELQIIITRKEGSKYNLIFKDNGPGVPFDILAKIFGRLLYGSKFHENKQKRGQQGLGASAVILYSQITTGNPCKISTWRDGKKKEIVLFLDVKKNEPKLVSSKIISGVSGTGIEINIDLEATYPRIGTRSVNNYLSLINIINSNCNIKLTDPEGRITKWQRTNNEKIKDTTSYPIYPKNLEVGLLSKELIKEKQLCSSLQRLGGINELLSKKIIRKSGNFNNLLTSEINNYEVLKLKEVIDSSIIPELTEEGFSLCGKKLEQHLSKIYKKYEVDFLEYNKSTVGHYMGSSFLVEGVLCYGGTLPKDKKIELIRVGNKVPFLFQSGVCCLQKGVCKFNWKNIGFSQSEGELPVGPMVIYLHLVSTKIPFISESKEAVSEVEVISKKIEEVLREISRSLSKHINYIHLQKKREEQKEIIEKFFPLMVSKICKIIKKPTPDYTEILDKINEGITIQKSSEFITVYNLYNEVKKFTLEYGNFSKKLVLPPREIIKIPLTEKILFKKLRIKDLNKSNRLYIEEIKEPVKTQSSTEIIKTEEEPSI
jgi:DNA topoisomerase-6 subunit B